MIRRVENFVTKILAIALIFVILGALIDLVRVLVIDLFFTEPQFAFTAPLLKIFGMFLNVLIALELMENVTAYLRQHAIQLELVVVTALTAVARKIVIFDSKSEGDITGLALAVLSLSISYWIIRKRDHNQSHGN
ncbi:MAG: phosphate-starvation-inducible PsiE family protein [Pseudanabaenaceae cyanobacterium bins.39]|nr:phosphate-starvation-inducible PsiE family protein [Pseudanabaenaceae cyanobacterium bins.39]